MFSRNLLFKILPVVALCFLASTAPVGAETLFEEDFESGWNGWTVSQGVWGIGVPTVGPDPCHSAASCGGTNLHGNYSNEASTMLVSPSISLPSVGAGETIRLRFWHWFYLQDGYDFGQVRISQDNGATWATLPGFKCNGWSKIWTEVHLDLTGYAGSDVQIGFFLTSSSSTTYEGWYVDDVALVKGSVSLNIHEDFEAPTSDWWADNGVWEIGEPTVGPTYCPSPTRCAATRLDGTYPNRAATRLISPEFVIDAAPSQNPAVTFWHWFNFQNGYDFGYVQISVDGGSWVNLKSFNGYGAYDWTPVSVSLSDYAGMKVRIAFRLSSSASTTHEGWYIDDVAFEGTIPAPFVCDVDEISASTGGSAALSLDAGKENAYRTYLILGSISGTAPGTPLPGGQGVLPLNLDPFFTPMVRNNLNGPAFDRFYGALDKHGRAAAAFDTLGPRPAMVGLTFYFAYVLTAPPACDFASNPLSIDMVP